LSEEDNLYYLKEIKKDITYFNRSYKKADIEINIAELTPDQAATKVKAILDRHLQTGVSPQ
jgi:hypothetical protein